MLRNNKLNLLISILIAIGIWLYVVLVVNPVAEASVETVSVEVTGVEALEADGLTLEKVPVRTVNLTVSAARSELVKLEDEDFTAYIDVEGLAAGKTSVRVLVTGPRGVEVLSVKPAALDVTVVELE
ncbi:MAG: hypothetical protein LBR14_01150 [Clostridiales Family XIII bacterium]|nr:hypothetical protein [Clostridiales Family XIII bacterium]